MSNTNKEINNQCANNNCRLGGVGGQAVLEGVMMKSKENYAIAVRKDNGEIVTKKGKSKSLRDKCKFFGLPVIRGIVNLVESLIFSFKTLTDSAEMAGIDLDEKSKFEIWLEKKFGKSIVNIVTAIASVLGVVLALFLFLYLPTWLASGVEFLVENVSWSGERHAGSLPTWSFNIIEGIFKIIIFILYIYLTSKLNDINRVYQYHGAEHKTIFCYEKGLELTTENVKEQKRFHPRCGTSFIFVILIISIAVMTVATTIINAYSDFDLSNKLFRTVIKLSLLPLTVGIGYEFIRYAGRHNNVLTRILSAPGLWMQRLTTREPDEKMIEVAITSLKAALPEEFPEEETSDNESEIADDSEEESKSEETTEQTGE